MPGPPAGIGGLGGFGNAVSADFGNVILVELLSV